MKIVYEPPHTLLKKCKGSKCKYWVDNIRVSEVEYNSNISKASIEKCKPCYLKLNNEKKTLFYEGDFYTDCCIGKYIEKYSSGKTKIQGQYKIPPVEDVKKENLYNMGYCRKEGEWKYFKENGDVEKIEIYKNGDIVK